jgi:hypothetical protein
MPIRRHRRVTLDDMEQAEALFGQLRERGELWADAERIVAEELNISPSTWRRWRARIRHRNGTDTEDKWFGPRPAPKSRRSNTPPDMTTAELLAALRSLLNG